jgi:cytochrome c oxidase subunit 2
VTKGRRQKSALVASPPARQERRLTRLVAGGVGLTAVVLFVLMIGDFATGRGIHSLAGPDALTIRVTGHQWWWEVQYQDSTPSNIVTTANEIHIPVGRAVQFELQSSDVIHSFWIPNLHGKRDMIPGHPTRTFLRADRAGRFRGQCAEFCGYQHAFMRFVVVAEPEAQFRRWIEAQRKSAREPTTASQRRGRDVFLGATCVMCHAIQGTAARAKVGPDLTHVGSRPLIGGILPNARGHLAGWIVDPQRIKPGVRMPLNVVKPTDLDALVDYLASLK